MPSSRIAMNAIEKQITRGPGGRILTNTGVWSPDGMWIVYDTRPDASGEAFEGERIEEKENLPALYRTMGERFAALDSWSEYVITAYEDAEKYIGRKADKNRKIYNGMMKTYFYQFLGPRPPKRKQEENS